MVETRTLGRVERLLVKDIIQLRFFTTDVDGFLANYDVYANWISAAGTRPPQTLLGIQRLVLPDLMVEIEAVAAE